ncbi:GbsR/MarR family transcriptional regulator [Acidisoma cellulosilytica]|uniref:HTH-type transcriptional regulator n=1 Tax=Acidisoma cellulosilyticum TaxID=2802395 RepID=A0A964E2R5_9PROT|nr:GbsR/MarR family transcriptional regulator [Acidisoma cellulosilyticum]MCB8879691.1 GbsR/MarR family transcriptional regulator [Acidisoma cellulosilyticum]
MELSPVSQAFVLHFGEMGSRWGINRTVGQIYALLFLSARPLAADEIAEALGFSRSNVSMGLKELQSWRLVRLQHLPGDRREHFSTPEDVWQIVRILAEERRKRELDPTLSVLRDLLLNERSNPAEEHAYQRMQQMHDLLELITKWSADIQKLETTQLVELIRMGGRIVRLLELKNRLPIIGSRGSKTTAGREAEQTAYPEPEDAED